MVLLLFSILLFSCGTASAPPPPPVQPSPPVSPVDTDDEDSFDPGTITAELFNSTKIEVQKFIEDLNSIIRAKNYDAWVSNLGKAYFTEKSSPEYLAQVSEQPRMKTQKIVLAGPQDYFIQVVVPSRANDRVDDIEFVTQKRVKAYTVTPNGTRLRLYDLENIDNHWKIIN